MTFDYLVIPAIILVVGVLILWLSFRRIRSLSQKVSSRSRRVVERFALSLTILLTLIVVISSTFNAIAIHGFQAHNPPFGDMYLVNGQRMHIDCTGRGSPTIVLEAGFGNDSLIWGKVQPALSKMTRVCSYDRAGYGWSDDSSAPRDADHIAAELHGLLLQAGVTGSIVLMGHSLGGIYIRDYATRYPDNVAGLIFIDSATPLQEQNPAFKSVKQPPQWITKLFTRLAYITNLPRLAGACTWPSAGSDPPAWKLSAEGLCHPQFRAMQDENDSFDRSGQETLHTGPYGALPVLIFSHDAAKTNRSASIESAWNEMQEGLKKLSTRSRRIVARGSTHYVQLDRANLVDKEAFLFIEQIRGTASQTATYGSTTTE